MIKIGIVGAGFIGRIHALACEKIKDVKIVGIVDNIKEKAEDLARQFNTKFFTNINDLILKEELDLIAVCTPTYLHKEIVRIAAKAKKNIFCEKPIALSLKDADEMINIVEKNQVKSMVGHVLRFWPEYIKAKEIVDEGYIGKPLQIFCQRLSRIPTRSEYYFHEKYCGGAAIDLQIHDLDYMLYLFGKSIMVESFGIYNERHGGWIHMNTNVRFENGIYGVIDDGWSINAEYPYTMVLRILCTNGVIEWVSKAGSNLGKEIEQSQFKVYKSDGCTEILKIDKEDAYLKEWQYFVRCIKEDRETDNATFRDGKKSLELALATIISAQKLKPVKVL